MLAFLNLKHKAEPMNATIIDGGRTLCLNTDSTEARFELFVTADLADTLAIFARRFEGLEVQCIIAVNPIKQDE